MNGDGTVFKLTPAGTETVLYTFCGRKKCADGGTPVAALIEDKTSNLYGTTEFGGVYCEGDGGLGCGTVFRLAPNGTETVLHSFDGNQESPVGSLIADKNGNLYSTTFYGKSNCNIGCGTVFSLTLGGTETVLHNFIGGSDGGGPLAGLISDSAGNVYGTTYEGGGTGCGALYQSGCGTIFAVKE